MFGERLISLVKNVLLPMTASDSTLGSVWEGGAAKEAYQGGSLRSSAGGDDVKVVFRNLSSTTLILCWIAQNGELLFFYELSPSRLLATDPVSGDDDDHIEMTCAGHAFCLLSVPEDDVEDTRTSKRFDPSAMIGGYRPVDGDEDEEGDEDSEEDDLETPVHLVTISQGPQEKLRCCLPLCGGGLRRRKRKIDDDDDNDPNSWIVQVRKAKIDMKTPYDTTDKHYEKKIMGGGFICYMEPDWHGGDTQLEEQFEKDLSHLASVLPIHARSYLQSNCPIWVNKSIYYGPKACPNRGTGCCYHPGRKWLKQNGLNPDKAQCVEVNDGPGYRKDLHLWGRGGVMVHEFSHAYHHRMIQDGYDNAEIYECYKAAMKEKLYACVKVHGAQGPTAEAYACENEMEYWAELSTAFLGGIGPDYADKEYNKWFPFNRQQLKEHDPRAYSLLSRLWKVDCK
jgi:hypothetical protein